jgi:glycerophosphoryl diester phosphodiesterase
MRRPGRSEIATWAYTSTRLSEVFPLRRVRACGARWIAVNQALARFGVLAASARHGIGVMVWTVDEPARMDRSWPILGWTCW